MGFFDKLKASLRKTQDQFVHEMKRIVTFSPTITQHSIEELEALLISADFGVAMTEQIVSAVRKAYETQGREGLDVYAIARREMEKELSAGVQPLQRNPNGLTVVSVVGVNGTGKTTSCAKLAYYTQKQGDGSVLAACDTFRAAAIEQLKIWGQRLNVPVVASAYGADPAAVAHDAVNAALARKAAYLFVDTAGRLHTKSNLMKELEKLHRVIGKQLPGAPHDTLLVLDATTGMNALNQAREFHKAVPLTGLVITKLDGTSKGGMIFAIQKELSIPVKFVGLGEQADDLQEFDARQYSQALFND